MDGIDERLDTIVIGGGQAGLAMGHELAERGVDFAILDANERIGHTWRTRWDSLRLFTPASHDGLPGLRFPAPGGSFPSKDEMADYLEAYAARFHLPVRTGQRVDRLSTGDDGYVVAMGDRRLGAANVVVATGHHHDPSVPAFAPELAPGIVQLSPPSTTGRASSGRAASSWWVPATRGPTSGSRSRATIGPGCPGRIRATSPSAPSVGWPGGWSSRCCSSWPRTS
jgi:glycine/D-amino acid oxidase-like deaminating enzyme